MDYNTPYHLEAVLLAARRKLDEIFDGLYKCPRWDDAEVDARVNLRQEVLDAIMERLISDDYRPSAEADVSVSVSAYRLYLRYDDVVLIVRVVRGEDMFELQAVRKSLIK